MYKLTYVRPLYVLVTGATGKQGGSVARTLLDYGHKVRGLTRNPESEKAKLLAEEGVEVVKGSFDDPDSIREAMKDVEAVFLMGTSFEGGVEVETKHGITVADIAKEMGIKHLVYTSVASANKNTDIPHFESKFKVEEHIRKIDVPYTIVRPVSFMENYIAPWVLHKLEQGVIESPLDPDSQTELIAVKDIGRFVLHVLENREQFLGKEIDIASERISEEEITHILSGALGRPVHLHEIDLDNPETLGEDMTKMYKWIKEVGYRVDTEKLHEEYPQIEWTSFEQWANEQDWEMFNRPVTRVTSQ